MSETDYSKLKVLVVGDVMLDQYIHGSVHRISPEAPVPIVRVESQEFRVGGAANVAANLAALGLGVRLFGLVGSDEYGAQLRRRCESVGINANFLDVAGGSTIVKQRVVSKHHQMIRVDYDALYSEADSRRLIDLACQELSQCDLVILSDYNKGSLSCCANLISIARTLGKRVLIDPKGDDFSKYSGAHLITPNMSEFELVMGASSSEEEITDKAERLIAQVGLDGLVLTRGEQGMTIFQTSMRPVHLAAEVHEVVDVTGAGDTVISMLSLGLALGLTIEKSARLANSAAGMAVARFGTAVPDAAEIIRLVERLNLK